MKPDTFHVMSTVITVFTCTNLLVQVTVKRSKMFTVFITTECETWLEMIIVSIAICLYPYTPDIHSMSAPPQMFLSDKGFIHIVQICCKSYVT